MSSTHQATALPDDLATLVDTRRQRNVALIFGVVAALAVTLGAALDPVQFFRSYLTGYLVWLSVALGSLAMGMLLHVTSGAWGVVGRRTFEAAQRTMPLLTVLFIPIVLGMEHIFPWAVPGAAENDALLQHKAAYLNPTAFVVRAAIYFAIWNLFSFLLNRWSREQDRTGDPQTRRRMRLLSAPGLAVYCLTATFAGFDWLMSLDPHWFSSIYGVYFLGCHGLAALAFVILVMLFLTSRPPLANALRSSHVADYGNLMFAFVALWGYFALSQFIIIWSGNLPEETIWYLHRTHGGWQLVALAIVVFHFAIPFLTLLSRFVKQHVRMSAVVAALVIFMRLVDFHWQVAPTYSETLHVHWLDLAIPVAIGGIWVASFFSELAKRPLLPIRDPNLEKALDHVLA